MIRLFIFMIFLLTGCCGTSFFELADSNLCIIEDAVHTVHDDSDGTYSEILFCVYNNSALNVESVSVTFSLSDDEGNSVLVSGDSVTFTENVSAGAYERFCLTIKADSFMYESAVESCNVDTAYINYVRYDDGSVWRDIYGMYSVIERGGAE